MVEIKCLKSIKPNKQNYINSERIQKIIVTVYATNCIYILFIQMKNAKNVVLLLNGKQFAIPK